MNSVRSTRLKFAYLGIVSFLLAFGTNAQNVTIGKQNWTQTNLDVVTFRNGDTIQQAKTADEWLVAGVYRQPAWCYYTDEKGNVDTKYGKLYNWYAVSDPRGLAPKGWHIPTKEEWEALSDEVGTKKGANKLKSTTDWKSTEATNSSGFTGQPGGRRDHEYGKCIGRGSSGNWWSATASGKEEAHGVSLTNNLEYLSTGTQSKMDGYSVRCIAGDVVIKGKIWAPNHFGDSIIDIPAQIGNLEVAKFDFPGMLTLSVAQACCKKLGPGWRVPTQKELEILYSNKSQFGGFINAHYWYYDSDISLGWLNFLDFKWADAGQLEFARAKCRAVRTI